MKLKIDLFLHDLAGVLPLSFPPPYRSTAISLYPSISLPYITRLYSRFSRHFILDCPRAFFLHFMGV